VIGPTAVLRCKPVPASWRQRSGGGGGECLHKAAALLAAVPAARRATAVRRRPAGDLTDDGERHRPAGIVAVVVGLRRLNDDYVALRHGVGAVPVGRDLVRIRGPEAVEYMQGQCSQDVALSRSAWPPTLFSSHPKASSDALVRVTRTGTDELYVDVDTGYGPAVITG